ncbi:PREDICTED: protein cycle isoform X3 [Papilio xuthus]|uniref:Protein cycle isoform X3 n=1 Tax=Papilio xuthus TaxID=66420 RepID=A0AAJ7E4G6_PAPXU|nr:PREDICTED: protein cycle isoform X3 [Papilio xuthus]
MTRYRHARANTSAASAYELTAGNGCEGGALLAAHTPADTTSLPLATHQNDPRKRKNHQYTESYEMANCENSLATPATSTVTVLDNATRKRKPSSYGTASAYDDDGTDDTRSTRTMPDKKQNHSEIEKRRRDKMNTYISELSAMIPMCGAMSRKLDKLTVLRMAVQYLRSVRGALSAGPLTARPRPAFLSERELNAMVLHAAHNAFLLVVGCDRGRLLYVSTSVSRMLHYDQSELLGQSLFDILHPKDVAKVKEQLSSSDLSPRERLIDAKTMLPVKADMVAGASRLCPGARRSFFCRIKCRALTSASSTPPAPGPTTQQSAGQVKEEGEGSSKMRKKQNEKKYCVVQCTGYLKSWAPAELEGGSTTGDGGEDGEAGNMSCLVAVGRALPDLSPTLGQQVPIPTQSPARCLQYISRHATDGKFLFVDQRVTLALGFLPQELLGTSLYEYVSAPELGAVARTHKTALLRREPAHTPPYSFRRKDGSLARITTHFKPFKNPWTKDVECLVANNTLVAESYTPPQQDAQDSYDVYKQKTASGAMYPRDLATAISEGDAEMQRLIDSQVESHKIGSAIAEDALRRSSTDFSPELPTDLLQDAVFNQQQAALMDNILGVDMGNFSQIRNNVTLSAAGASESPPPSDPAGDLSPSTPPPISPPLPSLGLDGNGEAAMAVIMSLLEADAGLGGPVNFSGLPWPLP